jgi:hypothetical protein
MFVAALFNGHVPHQKPAEIFLDLEDVEQTMVDTRPRRQIDYPRGSAPNQTGEPAPVRRFDEDRSERLDIVRAQFGLLVALWLKYPRQPPRPIESGLPTEVTVALPLQAADHPPAHLPLYR